MSLTRYLTNNYGTGWAVGTWSVAVGGATLYKELTSPGSAACDAYASFNLTYPASNAYINLEGLATYEGNALAEISVTLVKPDTTAVALYTGDAVSWSEHDITEHLDQSGHYVLHLQASLEVVSSRAYAEFTTCEVWADLIPPAPENVTATAASCRSIYVTWDSVGSALSYTVYWRASGETEYQSEDTEDVEYTITGLEPDTTYFIYVTASNLAGESEASLVVDEETWAIITKELPETVTVTDTVHAYHYVLLQQLVTVSDGVTAAPYTPPSGELITYAGTLAGSVHYFEPVYTLSGYVDTPSFDFGSPDMVKTLSHITVKGDPPAPITITAYCSTDEGGSWTYLGSCVLDTTGASTIYTWVSGCTFILRLAGTGLYVKTVYVAAIPSGQK